MSEMAGIEVQDPLPGMTRRELGGSPVFHLFVEGQDFSACCGINASELTADDEMTDAVGLMTCWEFGCMPVDHGEFEYGDPV